MYKSMLVVQGGTECAHSASLSVRSVSPTLFRCLFMLLDTLTHLYGIAPLYSVGTED